jgi:Na+/melibiose symporter-like transporter
VIFAYQTFVDKAATAIGTLLAGLLLTLINYPTAAENAAIPEDVLARLGMGYMGVWCVFASLGIFFLSSCDFARPIRTGLFVRTED